MRALVTGCAGFIGSHLTESLLGDGYDVLGVDCFNDNYGRPQKLKNLERSREWAGFDFVPVDLSRGNLEDLVEAADVIFHLAAEPGVRPSWGARFERYVANNVTATQHLLEAARRQGGRRLVYASSSSVYGEAETFPTSEDVIPKPYSPYGVTKLAGEHLCSTYAANHGLEIVALRYFSVYGPRQRPDMGFTVFCSAAVEGRPIEIFGDGKQVRDFTYVADVVAATRAAAERPAAAGRILNIGGGSPVTLEHALGVIEEFAGRRLDVRRQPTRKGDVRATGADVRAARATLDFAPSVALEEGLAHQWEWAASTFGRDPV